jgi:hypothetical protein
MTPDKGLELTAESIPLFWLRSAAMPAFKVLAIFWAELRVGI